MTSRRILLGAAGIAALPVPSFALSRRTHVIVVGGGGAGLSAAVSAAEAGARVTLLEKQHVLGGNTRISGGFYAAVDPKRQKAAGVTDSIDLFESQILENGGGHTDPILARILAEGAGEMLVRLESLGMRFKDEIIEIYGSHWTRCHKPVMPNGEGYIRTLLAQAIRLGVSIETDAKVLSLVKTDGRAAGVRVMTGGRERLLEADAVILTSGGFAANQGMVSRFAPRLAGLTHDNTEGTTGEMLTAAEETFGAALIDMGEIQCLPGCPPNRTRRVRLHNDVSRFIFVNQDGRRFVREDERRDVLRDRILALPGATAYSVIDAQSLRTYDILMQKETVLGVESGDAWRGETPEELAAAMGIPPANLRETIDAYNKGVRSRRDAFGKAPRELRHEIAVPPFWACFAAMTRHYTMGGLRISARAQVLDRQGLPVPGLYAAGEASGGIHGINRMGANGINDALVFGRIAGLAAAENGKS